MSLVNARDENAAASLLDSAMPIIETELDARLGLQLSAGNINTQPVLSKTMPDSDLVTADATPTESLLQATFQRVEQAKREWESTVDSLPELVCLIDRQGYLVRANRTVETWNLDRVETVKGRGFHDLLHPACCVPDCYLARCVHQAMEHDLCGEPLEYEAYDEILARFVHIGFRPVLDRNHVATNTAVVVIRDISELKRVEQEREDLIAELGAFAHTVAHDLKNPVGLIIGYATLLEHSLARSSAEEMRKCIQTISRVGYKLNDIIDELLILAEVRNVEAQMEPLSMANIVAEACQRLEHVIRQSQAEFVLPRTWPIALGHAAWVEEVWVNYLSNALKYGGQPPRVEIGSDVQPNGMARFWVRDNGDGIAPEMQFRIFAPFTRLPQARATGHGLGLSIVRRIIEKLHGQVGVESDNIPGQGCTVYFTLPLA